MKMYKDPKPQIGTIYLDYKDRYYEVVDVGDDSVTLRAVDVKLAKPDILSSEGGVLNLTLPCPGVYTGEPFTRKFQDWPNFYRYSVLINETELAAFIWHGEPTYTLVRD